MLIKYVKDNFDRGEFNRSEYGIDASRMQYFYMRFKDAPMHLHVTQYWESLGIKKEVFDIPGGEDRVYSVFSPLVRTDGKKYPLFYCFCDKADDYFKAETYGYSELSAKEQFICVYPQYRTDGLQDLGRDFHGILDDLKEKGWPIDEKRIYAGGFFYGASAAVKLVLTTPNEFAGLGLFCGSHIFRGNYLGKRLTEYEKIPTGRLPMICAGGSADARNIWPLEQDRYFEVLNQWMGTAAKLENFRPIRAREARNLSLHSENPVKKEFGLDFDRTLTEQREGMEWYIGDYLDGRGIPAVRFINGRKLPHIHCRSVSFYVWDYLKGFRLDGSYERS